MRARSLIAAVSIALVASACGGSGTNFTTAPQSKAVVASTIRIVGVGDSLTAGVQSGGLFGLKGGIPNPVPGSFFPVVPALVPFTTVPPTQGAGWWAQMWSSANGGADPLNPAISPLPLLNAPLGSMLVPSTITGPFGGAPVPFQAACTGANTLGYTLSGAQQLRLNAGTSPYDLGVPGQTLHEALYMVAPLTSCSATTDPTNPNAGIATIVNSESGAFLPVLETFGNLSQVQAATSLQAQYATVWIGSNDLLKPALSGGQFPFTDPGAFYTDMVALIRQLQAAGMKVAVGNLLDVLDASYFTSAPELTAFMTQLNVPAAVQSYYVSLVPSGGYLTLSGFLKVFGSISKLGPSGPPPVSLTASDVVPAAFAQTIQSYNDQYNTQINAAVVATGATLVDLHALYAKIYAGGGYPVNPPKCCSPIFGGGLTSLDGIHPSNTGYAIIANVWIATIDAAWGLSIPPVSLAGAYASDPYAPH
jgi:lysophospholipase L1-like esterase